MCMHITMQCTIVVHSTVQKSYGNLLSYLPGSHHSSDILCRGGGINLEQPQITGMGLQVNLRCVRSLQQTTDHTPNTDLLNRCCLHLHLDIALALLSL